MAAAAVPDVRKVSAHFSAPKLFGTETIVRLMYLAKIDEVFQM